MKKPHRKVQPPPLDMAVAAQLRETMEQTQEVPYLSRWPLTLELLSDDFLRKIVYVDEIRSEEWLALMGPLAIAAFQELLDGQRFETEVERMLISRAIFGIQVSAAVELERRHKHFCSDVVNISNLFDFDLENPVQLIAKDPDGEPVDMGLIINYYAQPLLNAQE